MILPSIDGWLFSLPCVAERAAFSELTEVRDCFFASTKFTKGWRSHSNAQMDKEGRAWPERSVSGCVVAG